MLGRAVDDEIGPEVLGIFERPLFRALLDEEIERVVDRHVGDDVDLDLELRRQFGKHIAREPIAVRILLVVHEMVGRGDLQRVRDDPGAAVRRGPEPDNLRAKGHRAVVFVMREVMNGGSDRHGLRRLGQIKRPFHNLLRRTIACGPAYSEVAPIAPTGIAGAGASPAKPQAVSVSSICDGAGASTSIGGCDFESGTTTLRASNCRDTSARSP